MTNLLIISLHASPNMAPGVSEWGGTHTYMKELLQEIDYTKFCVILITRKVYNVQNDVETINENCKIVNLNFGSSGDFDKKLISGFHNSNLKTVKQILKTLNFIPDIIHSVYWNSGFLAYELSKYYKINYVHSVISNAIGRDLRGATDTAIDRIETEKIVFDNAKYIICVGNSEKNDLIKYYNIAADKIFVAGQFVHKSFQYPAHNLQINPRLSSVNHISNLYAPQRSKTVGTIPFCRNRYAFTYTGRLHTNKGVHHIIAAWFKLYKKYSSSCPPLWIIGGDATDIEALRKATNVDIIELNKAEKASKLIWWGYLDEPGISTLYMKTLCLITNSLYEPGGRVAVEALCEGIPVIASGNGFAEEILQDWYNGFLVNHGDINKLARRMELFIKNPYLTDIMRNNCITSGNITLQYWDFINKHEFLYECAKQNIIAIPDEELKYKTQTFTRRLTSYPFTDSYTDEYEVERIAHKIFNKCQSLKIDSIQTESTSDIWEISSGDKRYLLKIPYNRIDLNSIYDPYRIQPYVSRKAERYISERNAVQKFKGLAPVIATIDSCAAIIRELYTDSEVEFEDVIKDIENVYRLNKCPVLDEFLLLNETINNEDEPKNIVEAYATSCADGFPEHINFSLRVELKRWYDEYKSLDQDLQEEVHCIIESVYEILKEISKQEENLTPVLNIGGCNIKNLVFSNGKTMFVDNERIHWGWPGIDYADYLITYYFKHNLSLDFWDKVFDEFKSDFITKPILMGWLMLDIWKYSISNIIMYECHISDEWKQLLLKLKEIFTRLQKGRS